MTPTVWSQARGGERDVFRGSLGRYIGNPTSYGIVVNADGNENILTYQTWHLVTFIAQHRGQQMFSVKICYTLAQ